MFTDVLTIPTLDLFPGDFLDSPNYILNLEVKKIKRLNTNNNPCEATEDYNMTACVGHYVAEKVGCGIPHNILYDERLKQCTAKEDLEKFFAIQDELMVLTKSELLATTQCLPPCSYYYYQLGNKAIGKEDGSGFRILMASNEVIEESEELMYDFVSLVAEFGGALGLFLGFSFLSLWDIGLEIRNKFSKALK